MGQQVSQPQNPAGLPPPPSSPQGAAQPLLAQQGAPVPPQPTPGANPPISQLMQRSVQSDRERERKEHENMNSGSRHMMKRHAGPHRIMRREAVLYPSKEAYDTYVVNNFKRAYDEVYPTYYSPPAYTTTQAYTTTTKQAYYAPRY